MKKYLITLFVAFASFSASATIHVIEVWNGYYQFLPNQLTVQLGDTIQWLPLDPPTMYHTVTSTNIPAGAPTFDEDWQLPADTFYQYIPPVVGLYEYECTPHVAQYNMAGNFEVVDTLQSTQHLSSNYEIDIYPNPASDIARMKVTASGSSTVQLTVLNINGRKALDSGTYQLGKGDNEIPVNVQQLSVGTYIIRLEFDDGILMRKLLVTK